MADGSARPCGRRHDGGKPFPDFVTCPLANLVLAILRQRHPNGFNDAIERIKTEAANRRSRLYP